MRKVKRFLKTYKWYLAVGGIVLAVCTGTELLRVGNPGRQKGPAPPAEQIMVEESAPDGTDEEQGTDTSTMDLKERKDSGLQEEPAVITEILKEEAEKELCLEQKIPKGPLQAEAICEEHVHTECVPEPAVSPSAEPTAAPTQLPVTVPTPNPAPVQIESATPAPEIEVPPAVTQQPLPENTPAACAHSWVEEGVRTQPTCSGYGESNQICTACGVTQTVGIPPTGNHDYVEVTPATCDEGAYLECSMCHDKMWGSPDPERHFLIEGGSCLGCGKEVG